MKKYKFLIITAFSVMLLLSCIKSDKNTILDNFTEKTDDKKDESKTLIADLPILIDSTDYIVFSVKNNQIIEQKKGSYSSRDWHDNYLHNLIFQHIKTEETHVLTKEKIKIVSYEQLVDTLNPSLNTTLYQIIDSFPKNDKEEAFTALYLSTNDGKNFTKISKINEQLHSWKFLPETGNIYFITKDDTDNNKILDEKDGQSMHSVSIKDYKRKDLLIEELNALN